MAVQTESITVRVSKQTHHQLTELARANGLSMQTVLDLAVEAYRRKSFLEALNTDFAALRESQEDWKAEQDERTLWEQTLTDGQQDL